jgi:hypothetical protein
MPRFAVLLSITYFCGPIADGFSAQPAAPLSALAKMPVKEITVFKDGHAYVLHEGRMPTDAAGKVLMDHLPTPVVGTFWPYANDKAAKLTAVTAGQRRVLVERTALSLRELLEANVGADVLVTETNTSYPATIAGFPTRSAEEMEATSLPGSANHLPQKGNVVLLKTAEGTKVVSFDRILDVKFLGKYKTTLATEEFRNLLTMKLDWGGAKAGKEADVGMIYLQKGVRWIPNYKVEINGAGKAVVKLQASLLNEMIDLEDVTVNLVVGVPTFAFKDTLDPISLGQTLASLSPFFESGTQTAAAFSNSMMTQAARMGDYRHAAAAPGAPGPNLGPEVAGSGQNEDLFIYTVKHVSLKKGQRLVLPVTQFTLDYKDVYVLDVPFAPPPEVRRPMNDAQQAELARLFNAPKVTHKIRLVNQSNVPLTTAPALIVRDNRVLAQGMMTYTAAGGTTDLAVTTAVDIEIKKIDKETKRTPNAAVWLGNQYGRVDLAGTIHLCSHKSQPVEVEVTRNVLGNVGEADHGGAAQMVNVFEDDGASSASRYPAWWGWYNWGDWWHHFNGIGRITWKVTLEPTKSVDLGYSWHYYWR